MIKYLFFLLPFLGLYAFHTTDHVLFSTSEPITLCEVQNSHLLTSEDATYNIYYNVNLIWMNVGEVNFHVEEDEQNYYIEAVGKSYSFYDMIYKVRDTIETTIDKSTMLPIYSRRVVNEGKYTSVDFVEYDYARGVAISRKGKDLSSADTKEIPIKECSRDILSTMYGVRTVPIKHLKQSKRMNVDLLMDRKNYPITVSYLKEDEQRIKGMGKQKVHIINPELIESETFKDKDAMKVYVSADGNNIPLMIETPISVGNIKAVLQDYK